jgi:hypothetical protein
MYNQVFTPPEMIRECEVSTENSFIIENDQEIET